MYLNFAWRYFRAKKSANAINIISWVTTGVIAFATCCQILVLSVFNGFEDLVKSLYSSFYTDLKIQPTSGKTFYLDSSKIDQLKNNPQVENISMIAEEKSLLQNGEFQTVVQMKGVDSNYVKVSGVSSKLIKGEYFLGDAEKPGMIVGAGIQDAAGIFLNEAYGPEKIGVILPKTKVNSSDPLMSLSQGIIEPKGAFSIQQDFDNSYAITNIDFVKQQMSMDKDEYTAVEISLKKNAELDVTKNQIQKLLGKNFIIKNRYEQNASLYSTMKIEKWAIYAVLTLILIIAAFNMISALTMLVLEKKQDISILQSMGANRNMIKRIFLSEGVLLGIIGAVIGIFTASVICFLQLQFKFIKLQGGSFLIDYFPVKPLATDYLMVLFTALTIAVVAAWMPSSKAARQAMSLR